MQIIALKALKALWILHPKSEQPLKGWFTVVGQAEWRVPADVRLTYRSADFIADNRVIFNIGGNNFRLVSRIIYEFKAVQIKFIGTHAEYDKINPVTVEAV